MTSEAAVFLSPGDLVPWDRNPRHNDGAVDTVAGLITRFGFASPVIAWKPEDPRIIGGHTRRKAALKLDLAEVPVRFMPHLSWEEAQALAIADNKSSEIAEWDEEELAAILRDLEEVDVDVSGLGFSDDEMSDLMKMAGVEVDESEPEDVAATEPPAEPVSVRGEVYALGPHRLMCGDSTDADDVHRLMGPDRADCCLTDPPYSVDYGESHKVRGGDVNVHGAYHEGSSSSDASDILAFMAHVPSDVMVWSYPIDRHFLTLADAYRAHEWEFKKELVWVKNMFSFWPSAKYQQKHEPIMIATRKGCPIGGDISAKETTVRFADKPRAHALHPTAKPIELWEPLLVNHVPPDGTVYEPFCGSGTTLIAAAMNGRKCYGMEISPAYCDVIRKRWGDYARANGIEPGPDAL